MSPPFDFRLARARQGARRIARRISHVGFPCRFSNYRIVNIMATCRLPFRVRLDALVKEKQRLMRSVLLAFFCLQMRGTI